MSNDTIALLFDYIKNTFDIPDYYCFYNESVNYEYFSLYATINDCYIYIKVSDEFKPNMKLNDIIRISNFNHSYDFLIDLSDYNILILNDIIKSLGGELYEKNAL